MPHEKPSPSDMAKCGFFYCLLNDTVQCAFCRSCIGGWSSKSVPDKIHRLFFPYCAFVKNDFQDTSQHQLQKGNDEPVASSSNVSHGETLKLLEDIQQRINCKVCFEREVSVRFNCKHIVTCKDCSPKINKCPVCRCIITRRSHVILC